MEKKTYKSEIQKNDVIITNEKLSYNNQTYMLSDFTSAPKMSEQSNIARFIILTSILAILLIWFNYLISPYNTRKILLLETLHDYRYVIDVFLIVIFTILTMIMFNKYRTKYYIKIQNSDEIELNICMSHKKDEVVKVYDALSKAMKNKIK